MILKPSTRFGMLMVLKRSTKKSPSKYRRTYYVCKCDCGRQVTVEQSRLVHNSKPKTHCGCVRKGLPTQYKIEYHAWWDMQQRCANPNHHGYSSYGAKGVRVCERWKAAFANFLEDMGKRPKGFSLDRIDASGDYEPGNVRWADIKTQARNKRNTKWVKHPKTGKPIKAAELAEEFGFTYQKLRAQMINEGTW